MWLRISIGILVPAAFLWAQGVQNPALTGEAVRSKTIAETNPFNTDADVQQGAGLFQLHCSYCHGSHGEGGRGADLTIFAGIWTHSFCRLLLNDTERLTLALVVAAAVAPR